MAFTIFKLFISHLNSFFGALSVHTLFLFYGVYVTYGLEYCINRILYTLLQNGIKSQILTKASALHNTWQNPYNLCTSGPGKYCCSHLLSFCFSSPRGLFFKVSVLAVLMQDSVLLNSSWPSRLRLNSLFSKVLPDHPECTRCLPLLLECHSTSLPLQSSEHSNLFLLFSRLW